MPSAQTAERCTSVLNPPTFAVAQNLVKRAFVAPETNRLWVAHTTFVRTKEGWLYLAAILGVFSRVIAGWAMGDKNNGLLCVRALDMAVDRRKIAEGLIHHSDQGSTYACNVYQRRLSSVGMVCEPVMVAMVNRSAPPRRNLVAAVWRKS